MVVIMNVIDYIVIFIVMECDIILVVISLSKLVNHYQGYPFLCLFNFVIFLIVIEVLVLIII